MPRDIFMADGTNVMLLTGAPHADALTWNEDELPTHLNLRHRRFIQNGDQEETTQDSLALATQVLAKWRVVTCSFQEQKIPTPKATEADVEATQFLSFRDDPSNEDAEHRAFLERSLYALQNLDSSQIGVPEHTPYEERTLVAGASFTTAVSTDLSCDTSRDTLSSHASDNPEMQSVEFSGPITDIRRIPNALHLESIHPQTMTINVLASIIAIQPTRTVRMKKRTGEIDIVEVVVGDETRAGFFISFWLPPVDSQAQRSSASTGQLRGVLQALRPGDVVLVTHVALGEFKNTVFGQSLSRRITRNDTAITLLSHNVTGLSLPDAAKMDRVRKWSGDFVGKKTTKRAVSPGFDRDVTSKRASKRALPPDTQPGDIPDVPVMPKAERN